MSDEFENKITLLTKFNQYKIIHTCDDKLTGGIIEEVMNLREEATKKALKELGWLSPEEAEKLTNLVLEIARGEHEDREMLICTAYFEDKGIEIE